MTTRIYRLHQEWIETKKVSLPDDLLPGDRGYNLLAWARELLACYAADGIVVRPFDDLPEFRLSSAGTVSITAQDVHRFIISDVSLIPLETRRAMVEHAVRAASSRDAWEKIALLLLEQLRHEDEDTVRDGLSWKFSPVAELLWAATWFFMEREDVRPPASIHMVSHRFPYYLWMDADKRQGFWEPEEGLCRWEWLALDLYRRWKE